MSRARNRRLLFSTRRWEWPAAIAVLAFMISGCVTDDMTPAERNRLFHWHSIDLAEVELNLPILVPLRITEVDRRFVQENVFVDRMKVGVNAGSIEALFAPEASVNEETVKYLHSAEFFSARMIETFDRAYDGHQEFREVHHKTHPSAGFAVAVDTKDSRKRCAFAIAGYRMKAGAYHPGDLGTYDTVVSMVYCDPNLVFSRILAALETVELVEDRAAFAEALRKKVNAAPGVYRAGGREI